MNYLKELHFGGMSRLEFMSADAGSSHKLTGTIIGLAMKVHREPGPGFLEAVYRNALCIELAEIGVDFATEQSLAVRYRGRLVGTYQADLIVRGCVLVETKAVTALLPAHESQLVNSLATTGIELGLLLNFGSPSLNFKRKHRFPRSNPSPPSLHDPPNPESQSC